jgi:hypothetical protein
MGQCVSQPENTLTYEVNPSVDLDMELFSISNTEVYNRGRIAGAQCKTLNGVEGITFPNDYLPSLKTKRRGSKDDTSCRLVTFSIAAYGNPYGGTAKALLTTKAPRLTKAGPPTFDVVFRDGVKVRVGFQLMPSQNTNPAVVMDEEDKNAWMATSIHFDDVTFPRFRIQMTRKEFPFLVQLFDAKTNETCVSLLTYGAEKNQPRTLHAFRRNIDTIEKAEKAYYSELFAVLDEDRGILAFQDGLRTEVEKAAFCIMLLMRTRLLTFNGECW